MADENNVQAIIAADPREWYFVEDGNKVSVPKAPLLLGNIAFRPPGSVTLWDGRQRDIFVD